LLFEYSIDEACATALAPDFGAPNADSCALLGGEAPEGGSPNIEEGIVDCALVGAACACNSVRNRGVSSSSSFVANGTDLIIGDEPVPYCVSGDTLTIVDVLDAFGLVSAQRVNY
jgi:hypothetical protein